MNQVDVIGEIAEVEIVHTVNGISNTLQIAVSPVGRNRVKLPRGSGSQMPMICATTRKRKCENCRSDQLDSRQIRLRRAAHAFDAVRRRVSEIRMNRVTPALLKLAGQLIVREAKATKSSAHHPDRVFSVIEHLRPPLTNLLGKISSVRFI